jgi:hypothetical protein
MKKEFIMETEEVTLIEVKKKTAPEKIPEKIKEFFAKRKLEMAIFVALVMTSKLTGLNFGMLLCIAIFLWSVVTVARIPGYGGILASLLVVAVIGVSVYSFIRPHMPRTVKQSDIAMDATDQWVTSLMGDQILVKAKDLWAVKRDEKGQAMLEHYKWLLGQGRPQEASDTLYKFMKAWNFNPAHQGQDVTKPDQPVTTLTPPESIRDSIFTKGNYEIPVDGITPFIIHVKSTACSKYSTSSDRGYYLAYTDSPPIYDAPGIFTIYPNKPEPRFQLQGHSVVHMIVN